jgi:hypothetical protein
MIKYVISILDIEVEFMNRGQLIELIIICSVLFSFLCLSGCVENGNDNTNEESEDDWREWPKFQSSKELRSGYSTEYSEEIERFNLHENYITEVFIELTWEDEPSTYPSGSNEPDTFNITIITPQQNEIYSDITGNPINGQGNIFETIVVPEYEIANNTAVGEWTVKIFCQSCGEDNSNTLIPLISEDPGNSWELRYYYEYHSNE